MELAKTQAAQPIYIWQPPPQHRGAPHASPPPAIGRLELPPLIEGADGTLRTRVNSALLHFGQDTSSPGDRTRISTTSSHDLHSYSYRGIFGIREEHNPRGNFGHHAHDPIVSHGRRSGHWEWSKKKHFVSRMGSEHLSARPGFVRIFNGSDNETGIAVVTHDVPANSRN